MARPVLLSPKARSRGGQRSRSFLFLPHDDRVKRARRWLLQAQPVTTYEFADRIFGLSAAGVSTSELRADTNQLLKLQREDGGWAQTRYLKSDAYATGMVLDTLFKAGLLKENEPAYQRGVAYLVRTQFPDGSW